MSLVFHHGIPNKGSSLPWLKHGRREIQSWCELTKVEEDATSRRRNRTVSAYQPLTLVDNIIKEKEGEWHGRISFKYHVT